MIIRNSQKGYSLSNNNNRGFSVRKYTLFMNHFETICTVLSTYFKVDLYKPTYIPTYSIEFAFGSHSFELHQGICLGIRICNVHSEYTYLIYQ